MDIALAGGNVYWTEGNHGSVRFVILWGALLRDPLGGRIRTCDKSHDYEQESVLNHKLESTKESGIGVPSYRREYIFRNIVIICVWL